MKRDLGWLAVVLLAVCSGGCSVSSVNESPNTGSPKPEPGWVSLFDGQTLNGWTPKIAGYPLGENYADTFRVEDGILKCEYDDYEGPFERRFGHLFTDFAYSHYVLRLEYKFVGRMLPDAPYYVDLNSGVMLHAQPPQSMLLEQGFPASVEMQFLADLGDGERSTGNICTPGTHVSLRGEQTTKHVLHSTGPTLPANQWVQAEVEVHGHDLIIHRINGVEVMRYQNPVLDFTDERTASIQGRGLEAKLGSGHIALQAEAQRIWFRNIQIRPLRN